MIDERFFNRYSGVAILCTTKEDVVSFLTEVQDRGIVWASHELPLDFNPFYRHRDQTCFHLRSETGRMGCGDLDYFERNGYTIVEYECGYSFFLDLKKEILNEKV